MKMNLDKLGVLFLDYLAELSIPVPVLFSHDLDSVLNKPHHDLSDDAVNQKLTKLCALGLVAFDYDEPRNYSSGLNRGLCIRITETGYALWQKAVKFNWAKYFEIRTEDFSEKVTAFSLRALDVQTLKSKLNEVNIAFDEHEIHFLEDDRWFIHTHKKVTENYLFATILTHYANAVVPFPKIDYCLPWSEVRPDTIEYNIIE